MAAALQTLKQRYEERLEGTFGQSVALLYGAYTCGLRPSVTCVGPHGNDVFWFTILVWPMADDLSNRRPYYIREVINALSVAGIVAETILQCGGFVAIGPNRKTNQPSAIGCSAGL